ncbi:bifunctional diguanylate cyclase/phosphodiesterase [Rheinheimera sp. YQF-2]|uniref:Bifunctional diguanylate cyclase/phosphodiesterase n=1 Tax=Rheinheimera lutimaris TaxID=2740584 RepID=A0A7Y5AMC7_9GAMM|nr:bifunctional diguanylate cyclase/phosphodiesterase [Rheinheimera lutimaris]
MAPEIFARLAIYLTQLGVALLLSYLLWNFSRIYQQSYIRSWFLALLAFAVYQLSAVIQGLLPDVTGLMNALLYFSVVGSSYMFAVFLLRGMLQTRDNSKHLLLQLSGVQLLWMLVALALITVLPFALTDAFGDWQQYFRVSVRLLLMGIVLLAAAVGLLPRIERSLGQKLAVVSLTLWGLLYIISALWQLLTEQQLTDLNWILVYKCAELFLLCCLGLALLIWLQEHERNTNVQLTEKTRYLNHYDQLTGALNRDALLLRLEDTLKQHSGPVYVLMLGLDKFKTINESVGLKQGDLMLRQLNQRFDNSILKPALIARTGGDIFALVLTDISNDTQLQFALRHLQQLVEKPFVVESGQLKLTGTIGFACSPQDGQTADSLLQKANIAFHQAKRIQHKCLAYQTGMEDESARLISWESELLAGMQNDEFVLYFQPQLNVRDNRLDAFEVLVRWQHPKRGFLMPGQFLPFVEQLGLSRQLDFWILHKAVATLSQWKQHQLHIPFAVNMSSLHFQQDGLKQKIRQLLQQYQVSPELLELEITENTAMHDMEKGSNHVMELQQMGIRVSIDDFGTGYSSLAYLRRMPIDKIKIDRSFVMDMAGNDSDMMIVKTMIKLAHGLGKRILAEGVETAVQLQLLKNMSCDAVQGYYIARPLSEADALAFCSRQLSL